MSNFVLFERLFLDVNKKWTSFIIHPLNGLFNHLTPKSDLHLISPYSVTTKSNIDVMRIKEMITNWRNSWLLDKFSLSAP